MKLFSRSRRDGRPVVTPLPETPPVWSDAEWHARVAYASRSAAPVVDEPVQAVRRPRYCGEDHETVGWFGPPGCWYCGSEAT